jgi:hypothetical protein
MSTDDKIIKIKSDNPNWHWEIYDKSTGLFLCYYLSTKEKKKITKKQSVKIETPS